MCFNAVLQEFGVFDLNHFTIDVYLEGVDDPVNIKVKDEMIVIVNIDQNTSN